MMNPYHPVPGVLQTIVSDNLDLGCALIEKAATDKAIHEIDDHLMSGYQVGSLLAGWSLLRLSGQE